MLFSCGSVGFDVASRSLWPGPAPVLGASSTLVTFNAHAMSELHVSELITEFKRIINLPLFRVPQHCETL